MAQYRYDGPVTGVTLRDREAGTETEVMLLPGRTVELPADHPHTKTLVGLRHLRPVPAATPTPKPVPKPVVSTEGK